MKLYDTTTAPNPRRVRMFLAEKGIDVPIEQVDVMQKQNMTEAFRAKNVMGKVPVLELDDGTCISESVAICRYFEETHPQPPLMGTDAKDKANIEMWQRRIELNLYQPVSAAFRHTYAGFADRVEQVPEWAAQSRKLAIEGFAWLDSALEGREFVAGERFSIADILALTTVDFARVIKLRIGDEHPNLQRWHAAMSSRPSAKA